MVGRGELAEETWVIIALLLPGNSGRRWGQQFDHRTFINGIFGHPAARTVVR
jgi:hypothetical protein